MKQIVDIQASNIRYKNILAIPSIHSRVYFAIAVREAIETFKPTIIAIEHPKNYEPILREAVSLLPNVSLVVKMLDTEESVFVPIDPCDSIIEAVRSAIEKEIEFCGIDIDVASFPSNSKYLMPDDYMLTRVGLSRFYDEVCENHNFSTNIDTENIDIEREKHMAYKLNSLSAKYERVLFVCGLSHWGNILDCLKNDINAKDDAKYRVLYETSVETEHDIFTVHKESLNHILGEMPFITYFYEMYRKKEMDNFDKLSTIEIMLREARHKYKNPISFMQQKKIGDYLRNLAMIEGNIIPDYIDILTASKCMVNNDYALEVMDIIHFYPYYDDSDERYPVVKIDRDPESTILSTYLKDKKINLKRYDYVWKTSLKKANVTTRPSEQYEGQWADEWNKSTNMLSHVPEDLSMEKYMNIMREKIILMLTEDKMKIEPFSVSIKDGIDMRETIRNYHKKNIYVKEIPRVKGDVGHMVMIFDEEHDEDYTCRVVWYSEAHDDSDLILYATEPGIELVGPGISKSYFGGYASLMPPLGPHDVWKEYEKLKNKNIITRYSDLLLFSAINFSTDKYLGYIAPTPPTNILYEIAKKRDVEIIYIPLSSFASETVNKLRQFHILGNKRLRDIADKYII